MTECVFCRILRGEVPGVIVYENAHLVVDREALERERARLA